MKTLPPAPRAPSTGQGAAATDSRIVRHAPSPAEAIDAAALLSRALGEGYVDAAELLAITPETGVLIRAADNGQLTGAATAHVLGADAVEDMESRLSAAGVRDAGLAGQRVGILKASAVAPEARGRGLGTAMLTARLDFLAERGCRYVACASWIPADTGHSSLGMLRRAGFEQLAVIPGYWAGDQQAAGYTCPDCGLQCSCAAVILVRGLDDRPGAPHPS